MSSRADVRAGRSVKRTVAKPPQTPAPKKTVRPSVCALFWLAIAAMFAGLFGWAYTHWDACEGMALYTTNASSCLELGEFGMLANENPCLNECDAQLHKSHRDAGRSVNNPGRRLTNRIVERRPVRIKRITSSL